MNANESLSERLKILRQKLTLLTGVKGEGDSEFTFQDFYDIEELIKRFEKARYKCKRFETDVMGDGLDTTYTIAKRHVARELLGILENGEKP